MSARALEPWPSLATNALASDARGGTWAFGDDLGDHWALGLESGSVLTTPFQVVDACTSEAGVTYLATNDARGIVRAEPPTFSGVYIDVPSRRSLCGVTLIRARPGERGAPDDLFFVASFDDESQTFVQRRVGKWSEHPVEGNISEMAVSTDGDVLLSQKVWGANRAVPVGGSLLRLVGDGFENIRLPKQLPALSAAVGLQWIDDDQCLVLFAEGWGPASAWTVNRAGRFTLLKAPTLPSWVGRVRCRTWRDHGYLPTTDGVYRLDADRAIRKSSAFKAVSLWPIDDGLVCRGWRDGSAAHEILRAPDGKWEDFHVPEPGVVSGGRGTSVWLGPKRKVPVTKVRVPAAKPPALEPLEPPSSPKTRAATAPASKRKVARPSFTLPAFLSDLAAGKGAKARKSIGVVSKLERAFGSKAASDLTRYFEVLGTRELGSVGLWHIWNPPDLSLPPLGNDPRGILAVYEEPALHIAAFSGTVALGSDGGGQIYYADYAPKRSDVFIYGPGVGELKFLSDSFTSFARLNFVMQRWTDVSAVRGWEDDDLMDGDIDLDDADFGALRALALTLRGKVNLPGFTRSDMASDFDEMMAALAGAKLTLRTDSEVVKLHRRADWIVSLLAHGSFHRKEAERIDRTRRNPESLSLGARRPAGRLYWTWHHFFLDNADALEESLELGARDRSALVRDSAALVRRLIGKKRLSPGEERFRELREVVRKERR